MKKVMIVDDELTIREGIKKAIDWKQYGMEISAVAENGAEALDAIEQNPPDILILDIMLNDIDGLDVLDLIRHKYSNIYVVLISGYDEFEYARRAIELNAFCYLLKPLVIEQLLDKLLQISAAIDERFDKLKKDKDLNDRLKESMPVIKDSFFCEIVNGKSTEQDMIASRAGFLGIDFLSDQYAVALLELHGIENSEEYDRNLIRYAAMDICSSTFAGTCQCYPFNIDNDIGLMLCGDEIKQENIREICRRILEKVNGQLGIPAVIGIGKPCSRISDIRYSYKEALTALEYKILIGMNRVIDPDIVYKSSDRKLERDYLKEFFEKRGEELKIALRTMNTGAVEAIASDIICALQKSIESNIDNYSKDILLMSVYLSKAAIDLDADIDNIFHDGNELYGSFKRMGTIEGIRKGIAFFFNRVMADLKHKQKDSNSRYISKAIAFIKENINKEISLTTVADALYVSSNYLSRIFRQEAGESFIEYIIREKMNEAKRLLENGNHKVYEVAEMLNYKDVNHFTKTFKKIFGVTPGEYRDLL